MVDLVREQAQTLQKRVNDRIAAEGKTWSPYEWRARAEAVADEEIPRSWEWTLVESLGQLPTVALLRHDPRRD